MLGAALVSWGSALQTRYVWCAVSEILLCQGEKPAYAFLLLVASAVTFFCAVGAVRGDDVLNSATRANPIVETYFDIPSNPLGEALSAFSAATGLQLFYETDLVAGRSSSSVRGSYKAEQALKLLLGDSGVTAKSFDAGTLTLFPKSGDQGDDLSAPKALAARFLPYFASLQRALRLALCRSPKIHIDSAEVRVRLWIAASGAVANAEVLSSSEHQQSYLQALRAMSIEEPPPQGMPQPVTLLLMARNSQEAAECPRAGRSITGPLQ